MRLQINVSTQRVPGTGPEGNMLISVQRWRREKDVYPNPVAWARRYEELHVMPASERALLQHAVVRLTHWLTRIDSGMQWYDEEGTRTAERLVG